MPHPKGMGVNLGLFFCVCVCCCANDAMFELFATVKAAVEMQKILKESGV